MNSLEYTQAAKRTLSLKFEMQLVNPTLLHSVIGLVTEANELFDSNTKTNFVEEIGDVTWYLAIAFDCLGVNMGDTKDIPIIRYNSSDDAVQRLSVSSAELLDLLKKSIFYGKELDLEDVVMRLNGINAIAQALMTIHFINREAVYLVNIAKLEKRFEEKKFTSEAALNRDLEGELKVLEQGAAA